MNTSWPFLLDQLKAGVFKEIDLLFAEELLKSSAESSEKQAILICAVILSARNGHLCFFTDKKWIETLLPENTVLTNKIQEALKLPLPAPLEQRENRIYLPANLLLEEKILNALKRLSSQEISILAPPQAENLNPGQYQALQVALKHPVTILTGGPGTGKTYTALKIALGFYESLEKKEDFSLILTAPTGRAAEHLKKGFSKIFEKAAVRSGTLHNLLGIKKDTPLLKSSAYLRASLIIVDECSMIDASIFCYLLESIPQGCKLLLMGDPYQLPAVGSGSIFYDIEQLAKKNPSLGHAELLECMRSDQQEILSLSKGVKEGDASEALKILNTPSSSLAKIDLGFSRYVPSFALKELATHVDLLFPYAAENVAEADLILEKLAQFKILSCIRKGSLGVDAINHFLKEYFFQKAGSAPFAVFPIMIAENDKDLQLSNGESGILFEPLDPSQKKIAFFKTADGLREIPALVLPRYEYAYCLSVHKSQGSEYERVLFIASKGSEVFGREVLYTALTRARKQLEIEMDEEIFVQALQKSSRRCSGLGQVSMPSYNNF